jgi:DNA-binding LytR/AlgR family response regulator
MKPISAVIAEDEPLLAESLKRELAKVWPELRIAAVVGDGKSAVDQSLALQPDVLFLDIQMPVLTGLEAAAQLAANWQESKPLPLLIFVTAFDQYAVEAFDKQAMDYILKPVRQERLTQTVLRLQERLAKRDTTSQNKAEQQSNFDQTAAQLRLLLLATASKQPRLSVIQASRQTATGNTIHMIPIGDVIYFEAADKYIRVLTESQEYLIRTPLKDLLAQLDPEVFWQVHRGTVVRVSSIASVQRDESFKVNLTLLKRPGNIAVSRLYGHLFKAM